MLGEKARGMDLGSKLLLIALGTAVLSRAQSRSAGPLSFEVASVKLVESDSLPAGFSTSPERSGGRIHWITNQFNLVRYAHQLPGWRISGVNLMAPVEPFYVIDAKTEESASDDQIRGMLLRLLSQRLKIAAHRETRELNGYALVANKNGPKIRAVKSGDIAPSLPEYFKGKPELQTTWKAR